MSSQIGEFQVKLYMYDLNNCAKEFGFKTDDVWEVGLVTDMEKSAIEKKYFPTISAKILPSMLLEIFSTVKERLLQTKSDVEKTFDMNYISAGKLNYLIAFNPNRER